MDFIYFHIRVTNSLSLEPGEARKWSWVWNNLVKKKTWEYSLLETKKNLLRQDYRTGQL